MAYYATRANVRIGALGGGCPPCNVEFATGCEPCPPGSRQPECVGCTTPEAPRSIGPLWRLAGLGALALGAGLGLALIGYAMDPDRA